MRRLSKGFTTIAYVVGMVCDSDTCVRSACQNKTPEYACGMYILISIGKYDVRLYAVVPRLKSAATGSDSSLNSVPILPSLIQSHGLALASIQTAHIYMLLI